MGFLRILNNMSKRLFLAPHFSDIAWSCGGMIALDPSNSIVVNVFNLKPTKETKQKYKDFIQENYRKPEKKFQTMFKFTALKFDLAEALDRGRTPSTIFSKELTASEKELVYEIRDKIHALIDQHKITEIYCPKAQRNQTDHFIVKEAVNKITKEVHIFYYKDFPNFLPEDSDKTEVNLELIKFDITNVIEQKIAAISLYEKALKTFYQSKEKIIALIRKNPYEIYWKVIG